MDIISHKECLRRLESGEIVEIEFYRYDEERQTGGEIDSFHCQLLQRDNEDLTENVKNVDILTKNVKNANIPPKKRPFIKRVRIVVDGQRTAAIRTIHPILIRKFNGIKAVP